LSPFILKDMILSRKKGFVGARIKEVG